jgi:hypothetical protein
MAARFFADVHIPGPVIHQLRLRGVDITAATEENHERKSDEELLILATAAGRIMVTQDIRFRVLAEDWLRAGRLFGGLIFAHQRRVSFGDMISDLELIARETDADYWRNRVEQLPL